MHKTYLRLIIIEELTIGKFTGNINVQLEHT